MLLIVFKTDWSTRRDNTIYIDMKKKWGFKNIKKIAEFPSNVLLTYTICLKKKSCHRFRIHDKKGDGLGFGWYSVYWKGKKISFIFIIINSYFAKN